MLLRRAARRQRQRDPVPGELGRALVVRGELGWGAPRRCFPRV
jgi:hypothetical protein